MDEQTLAVRIRLFFRSLFGSRLVSTLEEQLMRVRADCDTRLNDKEEIIADLRTRLARLEMKLETYERVLIPLKSPAGDFLSSSPRRAAVSEPPIESGWAAIRAEHARKEAEEAERLKEQDETPVEV